jgi:serine protease Do
LGYPFRQEHISCHSGIISAIYDSNITKTIQLDASVNHGNSGGPLFDPKMGDVIGVITRKATGLTDAFSHIRNYLNSANEVLSSRQGGVLLSGVDPLKNLKDNNMNMIAILAEIERQSNVGIGYAFSIDHILDALVHLVGPKMSSLSQTNVNPHSSS